MIDPCPGQFGDVNQSLDTANIHERTKILDAGNGALTGLAHLNRLQHLASISARRALTRQFIRKNHFPAFAVCLQYHDRNVLTNQAFGIFRRIRNDMGGRNKPANPIIFGYESAFDARDNPNIDHFFGLGDGHNLVPCHFVLRTLHR